MKAERDPNRKALAAAIALPAGARRDLQVAEQAAGLAASRHWEAQSKLDELHNVVAAPSGALAAAFIASVGAGDPCGTTVLERSEIDARAKMTAAESDVNVWKQTHEECDLAVRWKRDAVASAKERVERAARMVIANSETVTRLMDGLEAMQAEIINRRVALRFILFKGINGELSGPDKERIENLFRQDRLPAGFASAYNTGWEQHPVHDAWQSAGAPLPGLPNQGEIEIAGVCTVSPAGLIEELLTIDKLIARRSLGRPRSCQLESYFGRLEVPHLFLASN